MAEGEERSDTMETENPRLSKPEMTFLELPGHIRQVGSSSSLSMSDYSDELNASQSSYQEQPDKAGLALFNVCVEDVALAPIHLQELLTENLPEIFPSSPVGQDRDASSAPTSPLESKTCERQTLLEKYMLWGRMSIPFLVFAFLGVVLIVLARSHLSQLLSLLEHLPWFESFVVFIFLFTLISFPFGIGYIVLNMVAGYLYGFFRGQLVVMVSVTIGFTVSFFLCRIWFRDYAQRIVTSNALQAIMRVVEGKNGMKVIVLTRLTPIPFGLQNVLFSMTSISYPRCLLASSLGLIPTQCINTYMGSTVRNMHEVLGNQVDGYIVLIAQILFSIVLMIYVVRKARRELAKLTEEAQETDHQQKSMA